MAESMRIRDQAGNKASVRVPMSHEMDTCHRQDAAGTTFPDRFVQEALGAGAATAPAEPAAAVATRCGPGTCCGR